MDEATTDALPGGLKRRSSAPTVENAGHGVGMTGRLQMTQPPMSAYGMPSCPRSCRRSRGVYTTILPWHLRARCRRASPMLHLSKLTDEVLTVANDAIEVVTRSSLLEATSGNALLRLLTSHLGCGRRAGCKGDDGESAPQHL
uniref:Uncharacterized protein n=1 Tax=Haptolina brevifila TaxID=156173 RepID=A0A7S2H482_9EUKA|mmetsp:Transcript_51068/g.101617  ORF Transcript_51068/g.101617 Transcript_51068/m.101617 type:complete len:143 (+) Transcript_51068:180-608(+)